MENPSLVSDETLQAILDEIPTLENCEHPQADTPANLPQSRGKFESMLEHQAAIPSSPPANLPPSRGKFESMLEHQEVKHDADEPSNRKRKSDMTPDKPDTKQQRITAKANETRSLRITTAKIANKIKSQLSNLLSLVGSIFNIQPDNKDSRYAIQDLPYLMKNGIDPDKIVAAFKFVAEKYPNDTELCDQFNMISSSCLKLLKVHGKIVEEKKALETKNLKLGKILMQIADGNIKVFNTAIENLSALKDTELYTDPKLTKCIKTLEDEIKRLENPEEEE